MNTKQTPRSSTPPSADPLPPLKARRHHVPQLLNWLVGLIVASVLAGLALPTFGGGCGRAGSQIKAMMHAKQIGLALKLFAGDHEGEYPRAGLPGMPAAKVSDANAAFAMLFPTYLTNETLFGNQLSAYQTRPPDDVIDVPYTGRPVRTLEPGENVYVYVAGLTESSPPSAPLLADGTDGTGHYTTDAGKRGGLYEGKKALVVHPDNSAAIETLAGPDHARYIVRHGEGAAGGQGNLLDVSRLGPDVRLLDPAVGPR